MTKQEIIRDIKNSTGKSFLNISELADYFGVGREKIRSEVVAGLEYYEQGKGKKYFVNDIADRIMSRRGA